MIALGKILKLWWAAVRREFLRAERLYRVYVLAARRGLIVRGCGGWTFYACDPRRAEGLRLPVVGGCGVEELEKMIRKTI